MNDANDRQVVPLRPSTCDHKHVSLDPGARTLICDTCHAEVEPIGWLAKHVLSQAERMRDEHEALKKRNSALRRENARLEAQASRLCRRVQAAGREPMLPLPPDVAQVAPIGESGKPIGVYVRVARDGRLTVRDGRSLADAIYTLLDGIALG